MEQAPMTDNDEVENTEDDEEMVAPSRKAVVWRCSVKKLLLKTSQNSHENTCARVSFL